MVLVIIIIIIISDADNGVNTFRKKSGRHLEKPNLAQINRYNLPAYSKSLMTVA